MFLYVTVLLCALSTSAQLRHTLYLTGMKATQNNHGLTGVAVE